MLDTPESVGGSAGAAAPMELVLIGLAGCSGVDVVNILGKMRADLRDLRISARAEQAEGAPSVFTKVKLTYHFRGNLEPKQVERAISLSHETYCSVALMLKPKVEIEYTYEIETADREPEQED